MTRILGVDEEIYIYICMVESLVKRSFNAHLQERFNHVPAEAGNIESEWAMFCCHVLYCRGSQLALWPQGGRWLSASPAGGHQR